MQQEAWLTVKIDGFEGPLAFPDQNAFEAWLATEEKFFKEHLNNVAQVSGAEPHHKRFLRRAKQDSS